MAGQVPTVRVLLVTGKVAAGKSTVIGQLVPRLSGTWELTGIDEERAAGGDWRTLTDRIANTTCGDVIVESVLLPRRFLRAIVHRHAVRQILVVCDEATRRARMASCRPPERRGDRCGPRPGAYVLDTTRGVSPEALEHLGGWVCSWLHACDGGEGVSA